MGGFLFAFPLKLAPKRYSSILLERASKRMTPISLRQNDSKMIVSFW